MPIAAMLSRLSGIVRTLGRRRRRGNVSITFALTVIPIIALVGAGIDFAHAISVRAALQAAVNSTALMLSKSAASSTNTQLQTAAQSYFNGLFSRADARNAAISAVYSTANGTSQVIVTGSASVPTYLMGIFGYNSIGINVTSTTTWGMSRLRVALVLDNTGSMSQSSKMTQLQTATKNLLSQLQGAATTNADVYVSIVPFAKDVNVGSSNYNANWIYWGNASQDPTQTDQTSWDASNGRCSISGNNTRQDCKGAAVCSKSYYTSQSSCTGHGGTWGGTWTPASHSTWSGCVMDRGYPAGPSNLNGLSGPDTARNYDTNVTAPSATIMSSLFAAEQYSSYCPQAARGLSYDWSVMTTLVNNMSPSGSTNQAIGLELGWMSLAGGGPFTAAALDPNYAYNQVIVLLSDGLNTQDRWYGDGVNTATQVDARQRLTCDNIKTAGITIYTVQVSTDGTPLSTLLQYCASTTGGESDFFFLTSSTQIVTTFSTIGTRLSQLYIAK